MLMIRKKWVDHPRNVAGFTLLEVLITLVVVAVGVLGLAALQGRTHLTAVEANQRSQAVSIANDMLSRINLNRDDVESYVTPIPLGAGDGFSGGCSGQPIGVQRDFCEWSDLLKGASEQVVSGSGVGNVGGMIGARGCIEVIQTADETASTCRPAIVQVTTAWQGLVESSAPSLSCGQGEYGDERLRRAVATRVVIGLPKCL